MENYLNFHLLILSNIFSLNMLLTAIHFFSVVILFSHLRMKTLYFRINLFQFKYERLIGHGKSFKVFRLLITDLNVLLKLTLIYRFNPTNEVDL